MGFMMQLAPATSRQTPKDFSAPPRLRVEYLGALLALSQGRSTGLVLAIAQLLSSRGIHAARGIGSLPGDICGWTIDRGNKFAQ